MYTLILPDERLRRFIDCYWFLRATFQPHESFTEWIPVDARPDILFNFGTPYTRRILTHGDAAVVKASNLDGHRRAPVQVTQSGSIDLLGVRFQPSGLSAFVQMPLANLIDAVHVPSDVLGDDVRLLEGRLFEAQSPAACAMLLNGYFLARLQPRPQQSLVDHMMATIQASRGTLRVEALSAAYGYSARTINRLFNDYAGLPAKTYLRIVRFQHATMLLENRQTPLAELAIRNGYYDQAHFSKEFTEFSGVSPEKYALAYDPQSSQRV